MAPRTPTEVELERIWAGLLKQDRVGVTSNVFDRGADSLVLMRAAAAIREMCGVEVPVSRLVALPTIEQQACCVTELSAAQRMNTDDLERLLRELEQG